MTMACYSLAYNGIIDAAVNKQSQSTYIDLLGLTMAAQFLSIFTNYAWLILAAVRNLPLPCAWYLDDRHNHVLHNTHTGSTSNAV